MRLSRYFELSRGQNLPAMEGLRGFAVFLVFLVHYATLVDPWLHSGLRTFFAALHTVGNIGVDLFFVLSGYLIYGSLIARHQPFLRFMARRIERIYPTFTIVFLTYIALSFVFPAESKIPASGAAIYLIQNFLLLPGILPIEPIITVAWSLSYEMFYYLAMPVIIGIFGLRSKSTLWRVSFFLILAASIVVYCAIFGGHIRLVMFVAGVLVYEARRLRPGSILSVSTLVVGLLAMLLPVAGAIKVSILFAAFFVVCLSCFGNGVLAHVFSWTPLRWLGNMSYSYYLLHGLALKAGFLVLSRLLPATELGVAFPFLLLPVMFVLTVVPSAALFLLVERPFSLAPSRSIKALPRTTEIALK